MMAAIQPIWCFPSLAPRGTVSKGARAVTRATWARIRRGMLPPTLSYANVRLGMIARIVEPDVGGFTLLFVSQSQSVTAIIVIIASTAAS